ncbi:methyltransferase domain-containing protein [Xylariaceae sp. FL0594]|nr:methyltransferase domain-containing protein [Xylariaceae sp. FL0594]
MATFARPSFSAKAYAAFRPTYPASLFRRILDYHRLPLTTGTATATTESLLVDLGCGHGLVARALSPHFQRVVAIDPSAGMVEQARKMTTTTAERGRNNSSKSNSNITFRQGRAEELADEHVTVQKTVDMAVAGQAAHWFDQGRVWAQLARALKPGGTVAYWGYLDNVLVGNEQATAAMESFVYGFGEVAPGIEGMGPYWEQPGRNILRGLLRSVQVPPEDWEDVTRLEHEPGDMRDGEDVAWLRKRMRLGEVEAYTRTFSCYSAWRDAHPDIRSREEGGQGGDVVDVMWDRMVDSVPAWKAMGDSWREAEVVSDWGTYLIMARRR